MPLFIDHYNPITFSIEFGIFPTLFQNVILFKSKPVSNGHAPEKRAHKINK